MIQEIIASLPIEGRDVKIGQGYNGRFTHRSFSDLRVDDSFSLDFLVEEGTPVKAMIGGKVLSVYVASDSNYSGTDESLGRKAAEDANFIVIDHGNGIKSNYVHLQKDGAIVKPGDTVNERQVIGFSGNTGWSTQPHLHASFFIEEEYWERTQPASFRDYDGPLEDRALNPQLYQNADS